MPVLGLNHGFLSSLEKSAEAFIENRTVRAINDGLVNLIPLVLIGTVCVALSNLPIPALHGFFNNVFPSSVSHGNWIQASQMITFATADIIGLAALLSVSFTLAAQSPRITKGEINIFIPVFTAFSCYIILYVWDPHTLLSSESISPQVLLLHPGRTGVFFALFVALVSTRVFALFADLWQKMRSGYRGEINPNLHLRSALRSIFSVAGTLVVFVFLRLLISGVFDALDMEGWIKNIFGGLVHNNDLLSVLLTVVLMQVLWFFGAHGTETMLSLLQSPRVVPSSAADAVGGAGALPDVTTSTVDGTTQVLHQAAVSEEFYSIFVSLGGAGMTMGLLLILLILGSRGRGRRIAQISLFPSLLNINETLLYGVPLVLNPFFAIPFILAPLIAAAISYGAFALGVVPPIVNVVYDSTPILASGYLATGSVAGALLQGLCLAISCAIYTPFVLINKHYFERQRRQAFSQLITAATRAAENENQSLLQRTDSVGAAARDFVAELNEYFDNDRIPFKLVYQPKSSQDGLVVGAESLLRWTHPHYGPVSPVVLIEMTDEAGLATPLGRWIAQQSFAEFARWHERGIEDVILSINLNPQHIFEDEGFVDYLQELITTYGIDPSRIELEITEHVAVHSSDAMVQTFSRIRDLGLALSIDDMGMGYSSLTYISDYGISTVKIDISLVDQVTTNKQQQEIVASVVDLATQLNLLVIVEGVETKEQLDALVELGCRYYQGYYFSKPLEKDEFLTYVREKGTAKMLHAV
ncbi:MAG: EAL domain-containing protein [Coriobacteriales bacterium]|nr:EAL domain-containing protein [Coriobacteriales bacterium]